MTYKTKLSNIKDGSTSIRGYNLYELAKQKGFVQSIYLLLKGELPDEKQARMLDVIFALAIDNGPGTASAQTTRIVASSKSDLHVSVAAGILAMGKRHGSAIEPAANFLQEHKDTEDVDALVKELREKKVRVAGYGHAVLEEDKRTSTMFDVAKETGFYGEHCVFSEKFHAALNAASSKALPINVDGGMAAVLLDMGFDASLMKGFFLISRTVGLVAQAHEEITEDEGLRRVKQSTIEYNGHDDRELS
jgi:citrate synthase